MNGILIINKPAGITSHCVVNIIRKKFGIRRVGHAGTLDPMATGVLVILVGKATKLSAKIINDNKEYIARVFLGKSTDTQDSTGRVIEEKAIGDISIKDIKRIFNSFLGESAQMPPMVSAKKYGGTRLYKLARKGEYVKRKSCRIKIERIDILDYRIPEIIFKVNCSKGTYIRTLCEDIGKKLGYPAHLSSLIRTKSGRFSIEESCELEKVGKKDLKTI